MEYFFQRNNPLLRQHVLHVDRSTLVRQSTSGEQPLWHTRATISISDTVAEMEQMKTILPPHKSLFLVFDDDDESMVAAQAQAIREFVLARPLDSFLVHCYMGISRSAAVAKWIVEQLDVDDPEMEAYKHYNKHVYSLLKETE